MSSADTNPVPFELAKHNLQVKNIYLQKSAINTIDDFDRNNFTNSGYPPEFYNFCDKVEYFLAEPTHEGDKSNHWYKFNYSVGVRVVNKEGVKVETDVNVLVEIVAVFDVFYASQIEIPGEAVNAFAERNVQYHVWPFWREYVHSVCGRLGIAPAIEIPSYIVTQREGAGNTEDK